MKPPEPLEWQIQKAIVDYAKFKWKAWFIFHIPNKHVPHTNTKTTIKAGMVSGMPDLGLVNDGKIIFIEVKRPSGRLQDKQIEVHMELQDRNIKLATVSSVKEFDSAMHRITTENVFRNSFDRNVFDIGEPHRKGNFYDKAKQRVRQDVVTLWAKP